MSILSHQLTLLHGCSKRSGWSGWPDHFSQTQLAYAHVKSRVESKIATTVSSWNTQRNVASVFCTIYNYFGLLGVRSFASCYGATVVTYITCTACQHVFVRLRHVHAANLRCDITRPLSMWSSIYSKSKSCLPTAMGAIPEQNICCRSTPADTIDSLTLLSMT